MRGSITVRSSACLGAALVMLGGVPVSAAPVEIEQVLVHARILSLPEIERTISVQSIDKDQLSDPSILSRSPVEFLGVAYDGWQSIGQVRSAAQFALDPLLNIRVEIENFSDVPQYFVFQLRFPTEVTSGPTFKDAFANIELIDAAADGAVSLRNSSTFFEAIDDPGGDTINGAANLGARFFFARSEPGKESLFDSVGAGPNASIFGGPGFNWMRFRTEGELGAGDKLIVTGMGCYYQTAGACPERFELTAVPVPEPETYTLMLVGVGLVGLAARRRRFSRR